MKSALGAAHETVARHREKYITVNHWETPDNPDIHDKTASAQIWSGADGGNDIFVHGVGTRRTITCVGRYIKNTQGKAITTIAVEPTDSPVITQAKAGETLTPGPHKIQGIGAGFIPGNLDLDMVDAVEQVSNEECMAMTHRLMKEEGILAGISSGAAVVAAKRWAEKPENANKHIVVILASASERYLSSPLFAGEFSDSENVQ